MDKEQAIALLGEVRREIDSVRQKLRNLRQVEDFLVSKLQHQPSLFDSDTTRTADEQGRTQVDWATLVLRETGKPLDTQAIVDGMIVRGYRVRSDKKQLINSIFSVMRRTPAVFKKVSRGIWGLTEWGGEQEKSDPSGSVTP